MGRGGCRSRPHPVQRWATKRPSAAASQKTALSSVSSGAGRLGEGPAEGPGLPAVFISPLSDGSFHSNQYEYDGTSALARPGRGAWINPHAWLSARVGQLLGGVLAEIP